MGSAAIEGVAMMLGLTQRRKAAKIRKDLGRRCQAQSDRQFSLRFFVPLRLCVSMILVLVWSETFAQELSLIHI